MTLPMHKLLARQVKRVLDVDPASLPAIEQELARLASSGAVSSEAARFIAKETQMSLEAAKADVRWYTQRPTVPQSYLSGMLKKICERDNLDMTRADGPLQKAKDAYEIDTTHLTIEEQVDKIYAIVEEVLQK